MEGTINSFSPGMGNTAVVLSSNNNPIGKHENLPRTVAEPPAWDKYLRGYALRMQKNKKCMHCFMEFKSIRSFSAHLGNNHHPTVSYSTSSIDSASGEPICVNCRKGFESIKLLQQHLLEPCQGYWNDEKQGQNKCKNKKRSPYPAKSKIRSEIQKKCFIPQPKVTNPIIKGEMINFQGPNEVWKPAKQKGALCHKSSFISSSQAVKSTNKSKDFEKYEWTKGKAKLCQSSNATMQCTRRSIALEQKPSSSKRTFPKNKVAKVENDYKKHKSTSNIRESEEEQVDNALSDTNKKSVKTINSGSCIRQFSRPILSSPPATTNTSSSQASQTTRNKSKAATLTSKPKNKSQYKGYNRRVFSTRSLGLVDFDKIRTTARTRNMLNCSSQSLSDLQIKPKEEIVISKIERHVESNDKEASESVGVAVEMDSPALVEDEISCNGAPEPNFEDMETSAAESVVNQDLKGYLILKVMPIVQQNFNKSILSKHTLQKIQPKSQVFVENDVNPPLLVLQEPENTETIIQPTEALVEKTAAFSENKPGIRAIKTYGQTHGKKKKSTNESNDSENIDGVK